MHTVKDECKNFVQKVLRVKGKVGSFKEIDVQCTMEAPNVCIKPKETA